MPITTEKKKSFLEKAYFAVSDNPQDDVNPYTELAAFLAAKVGNLRWGESKEVRDRSKDAFADNFVRVLGLYRVQLELKQARTGVAEDGTGNAQVINGWLAQAKFPE